MRRAELVWCLWFAFYWLAGGALGGLGIVAVRFFLCWVGF